MSDTSSSLQGENNGVQSGQAQVAAVGANGISPVSSYCQSHGSARYCAYPSSYAFESPISSRQMGRRELADGFPMSPEPSRHGMLTEPRNYAPRTSGLPVSVSSNPPPKFDLGSTAVGHDNEQQNTANAISEGSVFGPGWDSIGATGAIVPFLPTSVSTTVEQVPAPRSDRLNKLTNHGTSLPTFVAAMDPDNFPFIEGPRQATAVNHGVVKLKNVSYACLHVQIRKESR